MRETRAPIAAPVKKPKKALPVAKATAKLPIAQIRINPFMERFSTPARSEIVSPMTAKMIGAAEASTPPMLIRIAESFIVLPFSFLET
jgi:hypothetical protein